MKAYKFLRISILVLLLTGNGSDKIQAQDSAVAKTQLNISYFLPVNHVPYLEVATRKKMGRKFEVVKNIPVNIYFDQPEPKNLLGQVTTDSAGKARIGLPASFKNIWDTTNEFKFIAEESSTEKEPLTAEITIKKAILTIDTTSEEGTRMVTAVLKEKNAGDWIPVKDIEMILSVKRLLGNLSVGDKETYTSDSAGVSTAEFQRDSMPGDQKDNIILVAQVVDNDNYGNLAVEKSVNWGTPIKPMKDFFAQRALWSIRTQTPLWLLFIVYSIVIGVWGTFIYLIFQVFKIMKLGA